MQNEDIDLIETAVSHGYLNAKIYDDNVVQFLDRGGRIIAAKAYSNNDVIYHVVARQDVVSTENNAYFEFCRKFSSYKHPKWKGYVNFRLSATQRSKLLNACLTHGKYSLVFDVSINNENINWDNILFDEISNDFNEIISSPSNNFSTYYSKSFWMRHSEMNTSDFFKNYYVISDGDQPASILQDALLKAWMQESGAGYYFVGTTYPGGTLNVVFVSTAFFILIGFIIFFAGWPIILMFGLLKPYTSLFDLDEKPFAVVMLAGSVPVSLVYIFM
jgi:hypothetical protein